jgi:glycosyltransferase involved in cell wall biosynthesis
MPYVETADAIIAIGPEANAATWRERFAGPIHTFDNAGYGETAFTGMRKDFDRARRSFLFFASGGQVQKGLDLLLEIFPTLPELHLYVCSSFESERDFCACYRKELYATPNVHPIGWVQVNGPEFSELTRRCASVILPSCSEGGQPGSVIQCMWAGLIPLVTREAMVETEDFGITLEDDSLDAIRRGVVTIAQQPTSWHREHSARTREVAETRYSEAAQAERWRAILEGLERMFARASGYAAQERDDR